MIIFGHSKFGLVQIKGTRVKRGDGFCPPWPERVFEILAWIGLIIMRINSKDIGKII